MAGRAPGYIQIRRRSVFTWIVGGFFTLVWIFLLGVMVGRGTITSTEAYKEVEQILAMDRAAEAGPSVEVIDDTAADDPAVNSATRLTFYDNLTQTDPQSMRGLPGPDMPDVRPEEMAVPSPKPAPKPAPKAKAKPRPKPEPAAAPHTAAPHTAAPHTAPTPEAPAHKAVTPPVQTRLVPTSPPQPTPTPAAKTERPAGLAFEREELLPSLAAANQMPDSTSHEARFSGQENPDGVLTVEEQHSLAPPPLRQDGDNFTIQVSAARTIEDADREVRKLRAQGYDAYTYQVELRGRKYFRIRVGRYETKEAADQVMDQLAQKGLKGMFLSTLTD